MKSAQKRQKRHRSYPKQSSKGKARLVFVLVIAFGLLVYFLSSSILTSNNSTDLINSETESFAAGKITNPANLVIVEAENLNYLASPDGIQVVNDSLASSGIAKLLLINSSITTSLNLESGMSKMIVRAKSDTCHGGANMVVMVGDTKVLDKKVSATSWNDYPADVALQPGVYNLTIMYTNDFSSTSGQGCDRNLWLDKVTIQ